MGIEPVAGHHLFLPPELFRLAPELPPLGRELQNDGMTACVLLERPLPRAETEAQDGLPCSEGVLNRRVVTSFAEAVGQELEVRTGDLAEEVGDAGGVGGGWLRRRCGLRRCGLRRRGRTRPGGRVSRWGRVSPWGGAPSRSRVRFSGRVGLRSGVLERDHRLRRVWLRPLRGLPRWSGLVRPRRLRRLRGERGLGPLLWLPRLQRLWRPGGQRGLGPLLLLLRLWGGLRVRRFSRSRQLAFCSLTHTRAACGG